MHPVAADFTPAKRSDEETTHARHMVWLAVENPIWMVGDSDYNTPSRNNHLLTVKVALVATSNPRNTDELLDILY